MKRPELLRPVAGALVSGSAHRQIARLLGCAPSTVTRISARLGRHCMLFQAQALHEIGAPVEPIVFDHFVTFEHNQLDRVGIGTPIGQRTWFDYGAECATYRGPRRRAARKSPVRSPRPSRDPASLEGSVRAVVERLMPTGSSLELVTDHHPAYRQALRRAGLRHVAFPNPPRRTAEQRDAARTRDRAMFPVEMVHQLIRHTMAHHRRETIAFGRRANAIMERAMLFTVWRNFVKRRSERKPDDRTPAMLLGIARTRLTWRDVLARRLFPERVGLSRRWDALYRRDLITPAVGRNQRHRLVHAY